MLWLSRDRGIFSSEFLPAPQIRGLGVFITACQQHPSHGVIRRGFGHAGVLDPAFCGIAGRPQVPPRQGRRRVACVSSGGSGSRLWCDAFGFFASCSTCQLFISWSHGASFHQSYVGRLWVGLSERVCEKLPRAPGRARSVHAVP